MMAHLTHSLTSVRATIHPSREEEGSGHEQKSGHVSVMLKEALTLLEPKKGDVVVDCTAGEGGHSEAILQAAPVQLLAIDADKDAVAKTTERLKHFGDRAVVVEGNFRDLEHILHKAGVATATKFLFDLGWNSNQLAGGKGFSFMKDEPLHMGYGEKPASGFTAAEIVNTWKEEVLADVFFGYGEERYARPIAKAIVARREIKPFETTIELVEVIGDAVPGGYRHGRLHFATKTFQALRIAVNDELGSIEKGVAAAWAHLSVGGRIVIITFHSLEDRLVKRTFAALAKQDGRLLTKKPMAATREEIKQNARSRSAKVRGIEKSNQEDL